MRLVSGKTWYWSYIWGGETHPKPTSRSCGGRTRRRRRSQEETWAEWRFVGQIRQSWVDAMSWAFRHRWRQKYERGEGDPEEELSQDGNLTSGSPSHPSSCWRHRQRKARFVAWTQPKVTVFVGLFYPDSFKSNSNYLNIYGWYIMRLVILVSLECIILEI